MLHGHLLALLIAALQFGQSNTGELRLIVTDQAGLPVQTAIELISEANDVRQSVETDRQGTAVARRLPFGLYRVGVAREGFAAFSDVVEIRSALATTLQITLSVASISAAVDVAPAETLIDPHRTGTINRLGADTLQRRTTSLPGRSLPDLVNTQPGWLVEANGILHPRGSEYQTQYVVDGLPLTDNRSPSFAPEIEADDVHSMNILTAGYPAEYGRKLGGIIEVVTAADARQGFHGAIVASGGSFGTRTGYAAGQYGWPRATLSVSADLARSDRYLDPPVEENFTNSGTTSNVAAHFERAVTDADRAGVIVRYGAARFLVPNERIQQEAGQRQDRDSRETVGQFSYQHVFSPHVLADVRGMTRRVSAGLWSNELATPMIAQQDRGFRETYLKGTVTAHAGAHEWKAGVDADFGSIRERFGYRITDFSRFDPDTPAAFDFADRGRDREQSLFVQDLVRLGPATLSAGLRWDHYHLLVDEHAFSPRVGFAWSWPRADVVLRASYDRAFQTPAVENLLLASSASLDTLNDNVVRLPVGPSRGNFHELGVAKGLFGKLRVDVTHYRRDMRNFADDDLLLNTGVSFPIAFRRGQIDGTEVKLDVPHWGALSGFVSYSNMQGVGYLPITGGLLIGDETASLLSATDRFPATQDQRHTVRARASCQITPIAWVALGASYGSGLPVEFAGDREEAVDLYGERIVDRVDVDRQRLRPSFSLDASSGLVVVQTRKQSVRLQVNVMNLTNRLSVINFSGLFSGTALAPPRGVAVRVQAMF